MLLGLHFDVSDDREYREELGIRVAETMGGRTRVFESKDLSEYLDILKSYKPQGRDNLVLVNTHYDFESDMSLGNWRATDITFNQKGGVVFGAEPKGTSSTLRNRIVTENLQFMADAASYYGDRSAELNKRVKGYFGRTDSDPHTLVFGFTPSWPKLAIAADALLSGLPDTGEDVWWCGVGFFNRRNHAGKTPQDAYKKAVDEFVYANFIAASATADEILTSLDVPHETIEAPRLRSVPEGVAYGKELRRLARVDSLRLVE